MRHLLARFLAAATAVACLLGALPAAAQPASAPAAASAPAPALEWLATTEQATAKLSGLRGDRARAIAWLAAFNAVNAIEPRYREYAPAPPPVAAGTLRPSADAALAAAIYTALALETDADQALLLRRYRESLAAVKSAAERDAGATLGQQAALMLLLARAGDRTGRVEPPPVTPGPGVFTTPSYARMPRSIAIIGIAPFAVRSVTAFDPGPPPAVGSAAASRDIAEVRTLGSSTGSTRSGEQTAAALFWNSGEPSDFSSMVRPVLEARKLDTLDIVRILAFDALINIDGNIVTSVLKERYAHWRPEAAIAGPYAAAADAAKDWQGLVRSPNSPDYPSGAATAAGVLEIELPRLFAMNGPIEWRNGQTGQLRRWPDAAAMAEEMCGSRVWAGAHFRGSVEAGRRVGRQVAAEILDRQLLSR